MTIIIDVKTIKINDKISYLAASDHPLSADIGIIEDTGIKWLFDVGNGEDNICDLNDNYNVVISHFHLDHLANISKLRINELYVSKETYRHLPKELAMTTTIHIVEDDLYINGLHIFPIASSHVKGSLALEVDEEYCFVGDALYAKYKNQRATYNVQLLNAEIKKLKEIKASKLLVSHKPGLALLKEDAIKELEAIYQSRKPNQNEIIK